jgi:hypothetical protein
MNMQSMIAFYDEQANAFTNALMWLDPRSTCLIWWSASSTLIPRKSRDSKSQVRCPSEELGAALQKMLFAQSSTAHCSANSGYFGSSIE